MSELMFDDLPGGGSQPIGPPSFDAIPGGSVAAQAPVPPPSFDAIPSLGAYVPAPPPNPPSPPPQNTTSPEKTNTAVPGFWGTVGSAFGRGVVQRSVDDLAGAQVILPRGLGGKTFEEQNQEGLLHPDTKDEIDTLLSKKVNEGWTDPKWWGAQVAHGMGGMVPAIGAVGLGALARVPAPISFGVEGGIGALVPAYKKARADGLDPEAATTRALIDSGIAAATATAMGIAPGVSFFGKTAATEQTAAMLKRPVMEMLAQLGLVQPSLAVAGEIIKDLSHGETPDPWGVATTFVVGAAQGVPIVGHHSAMAAVRTMRSRGAIPEPLATPERVQESFANQDVNAPPVRPEEPGRSEAFVANEQDPAARTGPVFYSAVREAVEAKMPDVAPAHQVMGILRQAAGVKQEELNDLGLPAYLADPNGRVNKKDLLAHIEAEAVQLEEIQTGGPDQPPTQYPNAVLPGEHSNYREFNLKVPPRDVPEPPPEGPRGWAVVEGLKPETRDFQSPHFPAVVNPIVHFRTTDRVGRNGERLLHVEEIQGEAHQEGAKVGYLEKGQSTVNVDALETNMDAARIRLDRYESDHRKRFPGQSVHQDAGYVSLFARWTEARKAFEASLKGRDKIPDLPFKTSWQELAVKRILRLAADEGYDGVSWANGDQVGLRLKDAKELAGARTNYDNKISSLFAKWAKKMGMDIGETKFNRAGVAEALDRIGILPARLARAEMYEAMGLTADKFNSRNKMVKLSPAAGSRIREGLPLYEQDPEAAGGRITLNQAVQKGLPKEMAKHAEALKKIFGALGNDMRVSRPILFEIGPKRTSWRGQAAKVNGQYVIRINTRLLSRVTDFFATMGHEFGHVLMWDHFAKAPERIKLAIAAEFDAFRSAISAEARTVGDMRRLRDNPVSEMTGGRNLMTAGRMSDTIPLSDLAPNSRIYILHFEEWLAENVAKWITTDAKPMGRVEKFFKSLADDVRALIARFTGERKTSPEATPAVKEWLDSLIKDNKGTFAADELDQLALNTKRRNSDALDRDGTPEVPATPATPSTIGGRDILDNLPPGVSGSGAATAAHADRMNWFYRWMTSLPQIAQMNAHIGPLQTYREIVATMNVEKNTIMGAAKETLDAWKRIRDPKQQTALNGFINDYMNGMFKLVPDGLIRRPTKDEFVALAAKHKMSAESLKVFDKIVRDFDGFLENYRQLLLGDAFKIKDPNAQLDALQAINKRVDDLLQRPFYPATRFGKYTITVYDSAGNVRHNQYADTLGEQAKVAAALGKSPDLLPGDRIRTGEVPKDATPLLGMPPGLIDLVADKLSLSATQRAMLDQLRFDYAPSQSFRHQFRQKDLTPGYSTDFQRSYAHFFFHGANHITRVKWVDALRDQIREVKQDSIDLNDANKRDQIANYMAEHLTMLVDPKPDFAALRGLMFHWYLGFNPASATLNLSQTPLMTFPHLASKFGGLGVGDVKAVRAILKASTDLNNFYKKGNLVELAKTAPPGPEGAPMRALSEAVKEGVISETQAHTLAATSEGRNLLRKFGSKAESAWHNFSEASSWMFEMTEQYNRRVAFRAAWELAMREPNNKYVTKTVAENRILYNRLTDPNKNNWSHQEAAAFIAAKDSVEKSQYVYAPYSRPKFMWGRAGALFIFKSFVQNTLFNIAANPSMAWRHLLILGALGGLMGLPGAEDINGILKAVAWHLFGKDFDVEDQARKFAVDVLDGKISPDMLLHGTSVKGFGIPHVMNAIGAHVGLPKFPTLDRHNAVGMGNILPFEPGKLFGPTKDVKSNEIAQLQRASGAGFSNIFAMYEFLNSQDSRVDLKKWEKIMPRAASNVSHAFRYLTKGEETNRSGNAVVKFDVSDTEHMAEILARAMGYQPRRLTAQWEAISAKTEQATYWDLRKQLLLRQFGEAIKRGDPADRETVLEAVKKYNQELPAEARAKGISAQTLKESVYQRLRTKVLQESSMPTSKQNIELFRSLDRYFPDGRPTGQVDARPVR